MGNFSCAVLSEGRKERGPDGQGRGWVYRALIGLGLVRWAVMRNSNRNHVCELECVAQATNWKASRVQGKWR